MAGASLTRLIRARMDFFRRLAYARAMPLAAIPIPARCSPATRSAST